MIIQSEQDLAPYLKDFQWSEHKKGQPSLFIVGAEFQAHFLYFAGHSPESVKPSSNVSKHTISIMQNILLGALMLMKKV